MVGPDRPVPSACVNTSMCGSVGLCAYLARDARLVKRARYQSCPARVPEPDWSASGRQGLSLALSSATFGPFTPLLPSLLTWAWRTPVPH